ncbi:MAG: nucleotidyltransferase domain-containing protein [Acidilobus sp.]
MPFEGWLAKVKGHDAIWMVRGYEHPSDGFIVTPYRASATSGGLTPFVRVEFLWCVGRSTYILERRYAVLIDPVKALRTARVPDVIRDLIDQLGAEWVGLTGSYAIGLQRPDSDVDLLVYSRRPDEIYARLLDLRGSGLISDCDLEQRFRKERSSFTLKEFLTLHPLKVLDSCYKGVPYTLRLLRAIDETPCRSMFTPLGWLTAIGELKPLEPYLTPATYIYNAEGGGEYVLLSWRTRYQELPPGRYLVRGLVQRDEINGLLYIVPDLEGYVKPLEVWARQPGGDERRHNWG